MLETHYTTERYLKKYNYAIGLNFYVYPIIYPDIIGYAKPRHIVYPIVILTKPGVT